MIIGIGNDLVAVNRVAKACEKQGFLIRTFTSKEIEDFRNKGGNVDFGAFGENLVIEGFELNKLPVGQRLTIGENILLEVTQIGKECHDKCAIYYQVGECIMPKNGIFTRVLKGGKVKVGDKVELVKSDKKILSL